MIRYLPHTDRSTTVEPKRLLSAIGPPSTTTARLDHKSSNSFRNQQKKNPVQFHSTSHRKHWVDHIFHELVMMMSCTYVHSERAGVWADVSAGESERFAAHLTEAPHERMIWDTNPYELQDQIIMKHKCVHETEDVMKSTTLTLVKGLRSLLREADLSRTRVTGPGSRSLNSSSFTDTLQKLKT